LICNQIINILDAFFCIKNPGRTYFLASETKLEKENWMTGLDTYLRLLYPNKKLSFIGTPLHLETDDKKEKEKIEDESIIIKKEKRMTVLEVKTAMENIRFADDVKRPIKNKKQKGAPFPLADNIYSDPNSESPDTSPREGYFSAPESSFSYSPPKSSMANGSSLNLLQAMDKKLTDHYATLKKETKIDISKAAKGKGGSYISTEAATNNAIKRSLGETMGISALPVNRTRSPTTPYFPKSSKYYTTPEEQLLRRAETMPSDLNLKNFTDPVPHVLQVSIEYANTKEAAVWVPDACANDCAYCKKLFTLTRRRHHCRKCGRLFCGACSSKRILLKYLHPTPVRVCDLCFIVHTKKSYEI